VGEGRGEGRTAQLPVPSPAQTTPTAADTLASTYATDPDMAEVIKEFVDRLPDQVSKMRQLLQTNNLDELRRAVHQMKGAGGGYGFAQITTLAARAEQTVKEQAPIESITQQIDSLIDLIRKVQGYDPGREDAKIPTA
jgi:HPt (histidine-containing phosphotransfer) domain-containing protein